MPRDLLAEKYIDDYIEALKTYVDLDEMQRLRDEQRRIANVEFVQMQKEVAEQRRLKNQVLAQAVEAARVKAVEDEDKDATLPPQKQRTINRHPKKAVKGGKKVKNAPRARKQARKGKR